MGRAPLTGGMKVTWAPFPWLTVIAEGVGESAQVVAGALAMTSRTGLLVVSVYEQVAGTVDGQALGVLEPGGGGHTSVTRGAAAPAAGSGDGVDVVGGEGGGPLDPAGLRHLLDPVVVGVGDDQVPGRIGGGPEGGVEAAPRWPLPPSPLVPEEPVALPAMV